MVKIYCFISHNQPKGIIFILFFLSFTITVNNNNKMTTIYQTHVYSRYYVNIFALCALHAKSNHLPYSRPPPPLPSHSSGNGHTVG